MSGADRGLDKSGVLQGDLQYHTGDGEEEENKAQIWDAVACAGGFSDPHLFSLYTKYVLVLLSLCIDACPSV